MSQQEINVSPNRILKNGAIELMRKRKNESSDIVLAVFENKFVVWLFNKNTGTCTHGDYHDDLREAIVSFDEEEDDYPEITSDDLYDYQLKFLK